MTDISPVKTHAELQLNPVPSLGPVSLSPLTNGVQSLDGTVDEGDSSIIKCICGYSDDDGNTVLCEECNSWQHIECYYHQKAVPEVHECVDCRPRPVDTKGATERQRNFRVLHNLGDRKVRKSTGKSHKKKIRDTLVTNSTAVLANGSRSGEGHDLPNGERASGSPRDQPPPAKRPKTSHRASASLASLNHQSVLAANSRKRAGSSTVHGQSPVKSPPVPTNGFSGDLFSPEFMRLHHQPDYTPIDSNSYTRLDVANDLSSWLKLDNIDFKDKVTKGKTKSEVFTKPDRPIEEMPAPSVTRHREVDTSVSVNGINPTMQYLTVDCAVPGNAYIGEVKGIIGFKQEYTDDPANRWKTLRHPEPFVFFPPHLPIYIDARNEGTELRYVRRSCSPNLKLQNFLVKDREYHFCLTSERAIDENEELTIGWDLDGTARQILANSFINGKIKEEGIHGDDDDYISDWVTGVLANFGGCACSNQVCPFDRFDRRNGHRPSNLTPLKPAKARRSKKVTPLSTGRATNSRAGSEAFRGDQDDDRGDSRSASGSSRSKPGSRDNTPMTHTSDNNPTTGVEMSEREKRKMQQVERMFAQVEFEEQHGGKKKKRNSAGSTLNTPSATTSKQLGFFDQHNSRNTTARLPLVNGQPCGNQSKSTPSRIKVIKPAYVDASTQTDVQPEPTLPQIVRRPHVSLAQRLLQRARDQRLQREGHQPNTSEDRSSLDVDMKDVKVEAKSPILTAESMPPPPRPAASPEPRSLDAVSNPNTEYLASSPTEDVEMKDVADTADMKPTDPEPQSKGESLAASAFENSPQTSHPPIQPPPPPWPSAAAHSPPHPKQPSSPQRAALHVQLPPPPTFSTAQVQTQTPTTPSVPGTGDVLGGNSLAQSPSALLVPNAPLFSPSATSAVTPSPIKKKMSLSDYTSRKKKIGALSTLGATSNQSPTAATSTSTSAPNVPAVIGDGSVEIGAGASKDAPAVQTSPTALEEVNMPLAPPAQETVPVKPTVDEQNAETNAGTAPSSW